LSPKGAAERYEDKKDGGLVERKKSMAQEFFSNIKRTARRQERDKHLDGRRKTGKNVLRCLEEQGVESKEKRHLSVGARPNLERVL